MDLNFNANEHEDMADFSILPKAWYAVVITASEKKTSENSGNDYMKLEYTIVSENFKGRKHWVNLNLWHPDVTVQGYAKRELASICRAVNVLNPTESEQMHNIAFGIKIGHKKDKGSGELRENILKYCSEREISENLDSNAAATATSTDAGAKKPAAWERK